MSEGGLWPWKMQKIRQPRNGLPGSCGFSDLSKPLPAPPAGQTWVQDESTREWKLIPLATDVVAVARPATSSDNTDGCCAAVPINVGRATPITNNSTSGVRYHEVLPTDTFQGICLRYKVTPTELRRANKMMGNNLKLAPAKLVIPTNDKNQQLHCSSASTKEEKIADLLSRVSRVTKENKLSYSEARAYLELADWDVGAAVENVYEDFEKGGKAV